MYPQEISSKCLCCSPKEQNYFGGEILKLYFKILTTAACEIILSPTYSTDYFDMKTEMFIWICRYLFHFTHKYTWVFVKRKTFFNVIVIIFFAPVCASVLFPSQFVKRHSDVRLFRSTYSLTCLQSKLEAKTQKTCQFPMFLTDDCSKNIK